MSPPASAIMSVLSSPEAAGGRDAIDAAVAQELGARFQVKRLERRGPRAYLYLGRALNGGWPIALKAVWRAGAPPQASEAFETAMAACARLDHPHIIPLHQYGQTRRLFWYAMQRIEGRSLDETPPHTRPPLPRANPRRRDPGLALPRPSPPRRPAPWPGGGAGIHGGASPPCAGSRRPGGGRPPPPPPPLPGPHPRPSRSRRRRRNP